MNVNTGKYIIILGIIILGIGTIVYFFHAKLNWIGKLPGDVRIERDNFRFYFPFTTMILFSIILTFILRVWRWLQ